VLQSAPDYAIVIQEIEKFSGEQPPLQATPPAEGGHPSRTYPPSEPTAPRPARLRRSTLALPLYKILDTLRNHSRQETQLTQSERATRYCWWWTKTDYASEVEKAIGYFLQNAL